MNRLFTLSTTTVLVVSLGPFTRAGEAPFGEERSSQAEAAAPRPGVVNYTCLKDATCIAQTPGHWWIGTLGGLACLDERSLRLKRLYSPADGLAGTPVTALLAEGATVWVATEDGISRLDTKTGQMRRAAAEGYHWRLEWDEAGDAGWAVSEETAVRFTKAMDQIRIFRLPRSGYRTIREQANLWTIRDEGFGNYRLIRVDTAAGTGKDRVVVYEGS